MPVTVKEIVRKITEEGHLLDYLPQCLVMDFFEFIQMHESRREYQVYYGDEKYETFKNVLLQIFVTNGFKLEEATNKVLRALNRGLSSFEQIRRVYVQYPLPSELKKELPNKKLCKIVAESITENGKIPQNKGVVFTWDSISTCITVERTLYADLYNFTLHPYLPHLLEAVIVLCLKRKMGNGMESGVRLFYPALQEKANRSYVPYFTISGTEVYLNRRFTESLWSRVLAVRDEILHLKMPFLYESLGEAAIESTSEVDEVVIECDPDDETSLKELEPQPEPVPITILEQYKNGVSKLSKDKQERFLVNDTSLLIIDDNLLRVREHWIRDGQGSRCTTQPWVL